MILCVNLNPVIERTRVLDPEEHDEVEFECAVLGGGGLNAARVLKKLGQSVGLLGFLPAEDEQAIRRLAEFYGFPLAGITVAGRCGETACDVRKGALREKRAVAGFSVTPEEEARLLELVEGAAKGCEAIALAGGLPQGASLNLYARIAEKAGLPIAADIPPEQLRQLEGDILLARLSAESLGEYIDGSAKRGKRLAEAAGKLAERCSGYALITRGRDGAVLAGRGVFLSGRQRNLTAVNPEGAGAAAFSAALAELLGGGGAERVLRAGVGGGSAKVLEIAADGFDPRLYASLLGNIEVKHDR